MKLLICEYLAGGGVADPALLAEGQAMLYALLEDFTALGEHQIATLVDQPLPAFPAVEVESGGFVDGFRKRLHWAEGVLVVAPETGGLLAQLSAEVEAAGRLLLGSSSAGVARAADKRITAALLEAAGILTPPCRAWPYPLVIKPVDGCGSLGVHLVRNEAEREAALEHLAGNALEQPYVPGIPASLSLLVAGDQATPLSLNSQRIVEAEGRLEYHGTQVGLAHPLAGQAMETAAAACRAIPGLQGFVGVDLVLAGDRVWVIEVNPRITTAYIGLRRLLPFNLAGALVAAARVAAGGNVTC